MLPQTRSLRASGQAGSTTLLSNKTGPTFSFINNIVEDMKSLVHPITISIASINTRLKRYGQTGRFQRCSNLLSSPVFATPVMAAILAEHFRISCPQWSIARACS
ncbi:UNVERIFIED_CONTAM: hypothetical protein FKN15_036864 [Acipenser sinensis]